MPDCTREKRPKAEHRLHHPPSFISFCFFKTFVLSWGGHSVSSMNTICAWPVPRLHLSFFVLLLLWLWGKNTQRKSVPTKCSIVFLYHILCRYVFISYIENHCKSIHWILAVLFIPSFFILPHYIFLQKITSDVRRQSQISQSKNISRFLVSVKSKFEGLLCQKNLFYPCGGRRRAGTRGQRRGIRSVAFNKHLFF